MKQPKIDISKLLKQLEQFGEDGKRLAVAVTDLTALEISKQAVLKAPVDLGQLRSSIGYDKPTVKVNTAFIFSNAPYSAFVEFGTGARVKVPAGFETIAAEFKGKKGGNFSSFLEQIRQWCKSHGIDEKAAYPIAVSILRKGLQPRPFLIPSYITGANAYPKRLTSAIEKLTKQYNAKK